MDEKITSTEANRNFSELLRGVRDQHTTYVVTSHGKAVAKIVPVSAHDNGVRDRAKSLLLERLASQPLQHIGSWSRDELYERE